MGVFIKSLGAEKNIDKMKSHIKYIGFRSQEKDVAQRGFFDKDNNFSDYKNFVKRVENHTALKHSKSVKVQKLVISLKEKDYEAYKRSGKDYKDLVRATLKEYEEKNNVKLDWIASIHDAEGHPHVHVVIKGVSDERDSDGKFKRIRFNKSDFNNMKDSFDKEFEQEADYYSFEKYDMDKTSNEIGKGFELVMNEIKKVTERENAKAEFKKDKAIKKDQNRNKQADKDRER